MNVLKNNVVALILVIMCATHLHAEIPFTHIKGLYTPIHENKKHLAPVHGFNWWKLTIIESMYRYGDADHATIMLLKELFFLQHDGITFDTTTLKHNPAAYFTPVTIGKILNALEQYANNQEALRKELILIINDVAKDMKDYQSQINNEVEVLQNQFSKLSKELKEKQRIYNVLKKEGKEDEQLSRDIKQITTLKDSAKKERESKKNIINQLEKKPLILVDLIINSAKESDDITYAKNTLQNILLAFVYKKSNSKEDFFLYCKQFKSPIITVSDYQQWLNDSYTQDDFKSIKKSILNKDFSFLDDYERASFFGYAQIVWDSPLPPIVSSIGNATYAPDGIAYQFPDCGETSLRNFFNIVLYDSTNKSFDASLLPKQAQSNLVEYYTKHTSANAVGTKKYYDAWTYVVSNIPGVTYSKMTANNQGFDITPGLDNLMRVIGYLLFKDNNEFAQSAIDQKLDFLCKIVSREDFNVAWDVEDGKKEDVLHKDNNTNITLRLTVTKSEKKFPLTWQFLSNHFVLTKGQGKSSIHPALISNITANNQNLITMLGWFSSLDNFSSDMLALTKNKINNTLLFTYFMQQLSNNQKRLSALYSTLYQKLIPLSDKVIVSIIASLPIDNYYLNPIVGALDENNNDTTYRNKIMNAVLDQHSSDNKIRLLPLLIQLKTGVPNETISTIISKIPFPIGRTHENALNNTIKELYDFETVIAIVDETIHAIGVVAPLDVIQNITLLSTDTPLSAIKKIHTMLTSRIKKLSDKQHDTRIKTILKETTELVSCLEQTIKWFEENKTSPLPPFVILSLLILSNQNIPLSDLNFDALSRNIVKNELSSFFKQNSWQPLPINDKKLLLTLIHDYINLKRDLIDRFFRRGVSPGVMNRKKSLFSNIPDQAFQDDLETLLSQESESKAQN